MLIDMIHDNHAEPPFKTRFRDPALLHSYGYDAIVIPDALSAIPAAYDESSRAPNATRNPADIEASIDAHIKSALANHMQIFFYADAPLLPKSIVNRKPQNFLCDDNSNRLCPAKPAVLSALQDQIHELFDRWPAAAGLIMRTGEVYPESTPHMIGSPLHASACPTCKNLPLQQRFINFIQAMHNVVIADLQKIYVHRAWQPAIPGLPNMHDDPETYRLISSQLPDSPLLTFSFKFTRGDFRQLHKFNPCLTADNRPKWIEFQCEREFEGKGAFPNYQAPLWQEFLQLLLRDPANQNLQLDQSNFSLWGWSRGGGWGGPYTQREEWIDSNVDALAHLYRHPNINLLDLATTWIARTFDIAQSSPPAPAIAELLTLSAPALRKLLYVSSIPSYGDPPWLKDDLLDVNAIWHTAQRTVDFDKSADACQEKLDALRQVHRMRQLFDLAAPELPNKSQVRALLSSLEFLTSFSGAVAHLFIGFVHFIKWTRTARTDATLAQQAAQSLEQSQFLWQQNTQHHALLPSAPSVFHENSFWDRSKDCLEQLQAAAV